MKFQKPKTFEKFYKGKGVKIILQRVGYAKKQETLRNVTEIHKNYPDAIFKKSTAFESDIHGQGLTMPTAQIKGIKIVRESKIAKNF
jgi:hypothetical protein